MDRFEAGTPRAPAQVPVAQQVRAQRDVGFDVTRQPTTPRSIFQQLINTLRGPVYPGPSLAEQTRIYSGPSLASQILGTLGVGGSSTSGGFTQTDLPVTTIPGAIGTGDTTPSRFGVRGAPIQFGGRRFSGLASIISRGYLPPYITLQAQEYFGWSDEDLSQSFVRGENGWVRLELGQAATTGGSGESDGGVEYVSYVPSYGGGGSSSTNRSGLVNWRI